LLAGARDNDRARFIADLVHYLCEAQARLGEGCGVYMHDVIAAAAWCDLVAVEWRPARLAGIPTDGPERGRTVCGDTGTETQYVTRFDDAAFLDLWREVLHAL
jgi:inosine-uridine nucleoside N-ribohydrolase